MKALDLIEATGQIDDRIILEVTSTMKKSVTHTSKSYKKRIITFALAAALILSLGVVAYAVYVHCPRKLSLQTDIIKSGTGIDTAAEFQEHAYLPECNQKCDA